MLRIVLLAQAVFIGGWLVGGAVEGHGYDPMRHDISDLTALTAYHPTFARLTLLVSGSLTIAVAFALRRRLGDRALLLALSLPALDNVSDVFFRLDCRAADPGCEPFESWHAQVHVAVFVVAAVATVAAAFRLFEGWRYGAATIALLALTGVSTGMPVQGLSQRIAAVLVCAGVVLLTARSSSLPARAESQRAWRPLGSPR